MKTLSIKESEITRDWYHIDATDLPLGRLASEVAQILRGKKKPFFTPHMQMGDFVVVTNAAKVRLTGNKANKKEYFSHSGYPGASKFRSFKDSIAKYPERVIEHAVRGMLPHNRLGRKIFTQLKVYAGDKHNHHAQKPSNIELN